MPDILAEMKDPKGFPKAVYYSQVRPCSHLGSRALTTAC